MNAAPKLCAEVVASLFLPPAGLPLAGFAAVADAVVVAAVPTAAAPATAFTGDFAFGVFTLGVFAATATCGAAVVEEPVFAFFGAGSVVFFAVACGVLFTLATGGTASGFVAIVAGFCAGVALAVAVVGAGTDFVLGFTAGIAGFAAVVVGA